MANLSTFLAPPKQTDLFEIEKYEVLPGIMFLYNTIESSTANYNFTMPKEYIEINYCKEGRFDCEFNTNTVGYLSHGDFAVNRYNNPACSCDFPMQWYIGITILVDLNKASTETLLPNGNHVNIAELWQQLCPAKNNFFLYNNEIIQSIFEPLYKMPLDMRPKMHLLKWWELLIYLSDDSVQKTHTSSHYLTYQQVGTIREVEQYLIDNIHQHITINELSSIFKTSPTTLKKRFSIVFGKPIFTYMREYRCHLAASLLLNNDLTLSEIAMQVGYTNVSKFSSAFNSIFGTTPSTYRLNHTEKAKIA